jgi:hypothetical protein
MKAVIYYEGLSERCMLNQFFHRRCQLVNITEDYIDFLTTPNNQNSVLLHDCEGYQNVFPEIKSTPDYYENNERVIILRDLEKTDCFRLLKDELDDYCPGLPNELVNPIFAKYKLEHLYLADLDVFKRVFRKVYNDKNGEQIPDSNRFERLVRNLNPIHPDFKSLFKAYNMAFSKPEIADEFFARFDFHNSNHSYFERLFDSLRELFQVV